MYFDFKNTQYNYRIEYQKYSIPRDLSDQIYYVWKHSYGSYSLENVLDTGKITSSNLQRHNPEVMNKIDYANFLLSQ